MAIQAKNITKEFAGIRALDNVSLSLEAGKVHALLGANGSGKSTFSKILSGVYQPQKGEITIGYATITRFDSPNHANAAGVAVVHQEAPLIDTLSVGECMALFGRFPIKTGRIDWEKLYRDSDERLKRYDVHIDSRRLAGTLSASQRALVSLVIALDRVETGLKLLILDEVTASLTERQAEAFLNHVIRVSDSSLAILMVTHRLAELEGRVHDVTIFRNGKVVHSGPTADITTDQMIELMAGPAIDSSANKSVSRDNIEELWKLSRSKRPHLTGDAQKPAIEFQGVHTDNLSGLDLVVNCGDVIGIAGLADSGIQDIPMMLAGEISPKSGIIAVHGKDIGKISGPSDTIFAGLAVLPADRLRSGGIGTLSISENIVLPTYRRWWHRHSDKLRLVEQLIRTLDVRPPRPEASFGTLSGGNQQKVIMGKWLSLAPAVLLLDDPTQGVDPNARELLFAAMHAAAQGGVGIILLSTEPEQLAAHCDKVFVLKEGQIRACIEGDDLTRSRISEWSYS